MLTPITAWGAVTAAGSTAAQTFDGLASGRCFLRPGDPWGTSAPVGQALELPPGPGRALKLAEMAATEALNQAKRRLPRDGLLLLASTKGDMVPQRRLFEGADVAWPWGLPFSLASVLAERLGFSGERMCVSAACASGIVALGQAALRISEGVPMVLVVAVDALDPFIVRGFEQLRALDPKGCRPFTDDRAGLSVAEGAAAVVLERDAAASVVLSGYGASSDAHHVTAPHPQGEGLQRALRQAMGSTTVKRIGAVIAHGTATEFNDAMEDIAYRAVFGGHRPLGHAHKGQLGHTMGAAGLVNVVLACESLTRGQLPPFIHKASSGLSLRFSQSLQSLEANEVVACASGFAGINAVARLSPAPVAMTSSALPAQRAVRAVRAVALVHNRGGEAAWRKAAGSRARRMDHLSLAGCTVGGQALAASGLLPLAAPDKFGVILGSALGSLKTDGAFWRSPLEGPGAHPRLFAYTLANVVLGELASQEGLSSEAFVVSAGRVSGLAALAEAVRRVAAGGWDAALVVMLEIPQDAKEPGVRALVVKAVTDVSETGVADRLSVGSRIQPNTRYESSTDVMAGLEALWRNLETARPWTLAVQDGDYRVSLRGRR